jgi:EAL domain-containing protein (putative c-di-GMP-specific phosphodiesterase class I)
MFIRDFPERDDGKLIRAVISMGKEMKLSLVVEGIETVEQYEWIRNSGCDLYQGYYGAKPLSLSDIEALINQSMH